jgi:hypothetical protein
MEDGDVDRTERYEPVDDDKDDSYNPQPNYLSDWHCNNASHSHSSITHFESR